MAAGLSADEIEQYDRQLRLWGITAQTRLRDSRVLLVNIGGLGAEVAKNLVLAGIGALTIVDAHNVVTSDLGSQFFLTDASVGQNRGAASLQGVCQLNPRVAVTIDPESITLKPPSFFANFDVVCLTECDFPLQLRINAICRSQATKVQFFAADTYGWFAVFHEDLGSHQYTVTETKNEVVTKTDATMVFPSLEAVSLLSAETVSDCFKARNKQAAHLYLALRCLQSVFGAHARLPTAAERSECMQLAGSGVLGDHIRAKLEAVLAVAGFQLNPICAIFGGVLSSEILKAISGQDEPWNNVMVFDGKSSECTTIMVK